MIKLNKCRTLYAFNEVTLAGMQQGTAQAQESNANQQLQAGQTEQSKEASQKLNQSHAADSNDKQKENKAQSSVSTNDPKEAVDSQQTQPKGADSKKNQESADNNNKSLEAAQETENQEEQKSGEQQQQSQYLFFNADEFIITTYQYENGWWYGYLDTGAEVAERQLGFFPSNYVQVIEDYSEQNLAEQQEIANMKESADMNQAFTWDDYAKHSFMNDQQILVEERMKRMNDVNAPENRNPDGILGYKKIKIHESRSHAVNPSKGGLVQTSQVAVKDQSQVGKAYRQMNHYFDYDAWIEERNRNPAQKAKADPSKRKDKKKVLNW